MYDSYNFIITNDRLIRGFEMTIRDIRQKANDLISNYEGENN